MNLTSFHGRSFHRTLRRLEGGTSIDGDSEAHPWQM